MRYVEDLAFGTGIDCGTAFFGRDEIIRFAGLYDPQPFHLDDDAAVHSLFGRLTASGLHAASATRRQVLAVAMRDVAYLGSPGVRRMQMHRPVYVDTLLRIVHTPVAATWPAQWPGIALVEGLTQAYDPDGQLVTTIVDTSWIGSRGRSGTAAPHLPRATADIVPATGLPPDRRIFFEDCAPGDIHRTAEITVDPGEFARYHADFDGAGHTNDWLATCLNVRMIVDAFWNHAENAGGPGIDEIRWPHPLQAGDRLRGELEITETRPLRSRPTLGMVKSNCTIVNQRGEIVSAQEIVTFIRRRSAAAG